MSAAHSRHSRRPTVKNSSVNDGHNYYNHRSDRFIDIFTCKNRQGYSMVRDVLNCVIYNSQYI